ncbi:patatin-like phospholipase family protein [Salsuginibacillus kocurii]|uniref:patatin-like phospholipase family protein n=1 Tax=Salsuginibacillus kocurii TaxID=427078 RepID=UPI0003710EBB|nr:patatin-like phospholipase family protein [Salsuginibacillus kocurii]
MNIDGVFAGGGAKAIAFIGALKAMEDRGYVFERLAGTSAGALFASLIHAGYSSAEIKLMLEKVDLEQFKDRKWPGSSCNVLSWLSVYFYLGLYKGDQLEKWVEEKLAAKGVRTFADMEPGSLRLVASDVSNNRFIILPDDLERYNEDKNRFSVAKAVRMSCALPYFYEPVRIGCPKEKQALVVDGGILSNFPMWLFKSKNKKKLERPVLGFQLSHDIDNGHSPKIRNAVDFYRSMFSTMRKAHDLRYISKKDAQNIVFISADEISATSFSEAQKRYEELIESGKHATSEFLKDGLWP